MASKQKRKLEHSKKDNEGEKADKKQRRQERATLCAKWKTALQRRDDKWIIGRLALKNHDCIHENLSLLLEHAANPERQALRAAMTQRILRDFTAFRNELCTNKDKKASMSSETKFAIQWLFVTNVNYETMRAYEQTKKADQKTCQNVWNFLCGSCSHEYVSEVVSVIAELNIHSIVVCDFVWTGMMRDSIGLQNRLTLAQWLLNNSRRIRDTRSSLAFFLKHGLALPELPNLSQRERWIVIGMVLYTGWQNVHESWKLVTYTDWELAEEKELRPNMDVREWSKVENMGAIVDGWKYMREFTYAARCESDGFCGPIAPFMRRVMRGFFRCKPLVCNEIAFPQPFLFTLSEEWSGEQDDIIKTLEGAKFRYFASNAEIDNIIQNFPRKNGERLADIISWLFKMVVRAAMETLSVIPTYGYNMFGHESGRIGQLLVNQSRPYAAVLVLEGKNALSESVKQYLADRMVAGWQCECENIPGCYGCNVWKMSCPHARAWLTECGLTIGFPMKMVAQNMPIGEMILDDVLAICDIRAAFRPQARLCMAARPNYDGWCRLLVPHLFPAPPPHAALTHVEPTAEQQEYAGFVHDCVRVLTRDPTQLILDYVI